MNEYDGMAFVKLYTNRACTREIDKDVNDDYVFNVNKISNNAHNPLTITFYAKNIGSHKAYDFKMTKLTTPIDYTLISNKSTLLPTEISICKAKIVVPNDNITYTFSIKVEYDNV